MSASAARYRYSSRNWTVARLKSGSRRSGGRSCIQGLLATRVEYENGKLRRKDGRSSWVGFSQGEAGTGSGRRASRVTWRIWIVTWFMASSPCGGLRLSHRSVPELDDRVDPRLDVVARLLNRREVELGRQRKDQVDLRAVADL